MLVPVLVLLALNPSGEESRGWAMVMATDTAFAVGMLALVGGRVPLRLRSFILTLVIVDDIGPLNRSSTNVPGDHATESREPQLSAGSR